MSIRSLKKLLTQTDKDNWEEKILSEIRQRASSLPPAEAMKMLFRIDNSLYILQGQTSIRYGGGVHTKHKHIRYHDFFTTNINSGENVLDIGCSVGELTHDIALNAAPGEVWGVEIDHSKAERAQHNYQLDNLKFIHGDATKDLPEREFDVITLSNVLEHIEHRPELLNKLNAKYHPKRFLIRVPLFERDWRVPLKKELGLDYRLDDTHFIEYTDDIFLAEMEKAGLKVQDMRIKWGEIWAIVVPK